jgi:tetratricopeptide (TPR) repeat protein
LALAWFLTAYPNRGVTVAATVVLVCLGVRSGIQAGVWQNTGTLYEHALSMNPDNPTAHHALAGYDFALGHQSDEIARQEMQDGDMALAEAETEIAARKYQDSIENYKASIQRAPDDGGEYLLLAVDYQTVGQFDDGVKVLEKVKALLDAGKLKNSADVDPANLELALGIMYYHAGRYADAVHAFEESLRIKDNPETRKMLQQAEEKLPAATRATTMGS